MSLSISPERPDSPYIGGCLQSPHTWKDTLINRKTSSIALGILLVTGGVCLYSFTQVAFYIKAVATPLATLEGAKLIIQAIIAIALVRLLCRDKEKRSETTNPGSIVINQPPITVQMRRTHGPRRVTPIAHAGLVPPDRTGLSSSSSSSDEWASFTPINMGDSLNANQMGATGSKDQRLEAAPPQPSNINQATGAAVK